MVGGTTSSSPELDDRTVGWNSAVAIAVVVAFVSGGVVGWLVGSPWNGGSATASEESVQLVDEWAEAVRAEDPERISNLYAEGAVWYDDAVGDRFTGVAGAYRGWNIFGYVDGVRSVDVIAVGDDRAAVRWTFGLPDGGEITGVSILEFDDSLISAETVYYDSRQAPA